MKNITIKKNKHKGGSSLDSRIPESVWETLNPTIRERYAEDENDPGWYNLIIQTFTPIITTITKIPKKPLHGGVYKQKTRSNKKHISKRKSSKRISKRKSSKGKSKRKSLNVHSMVKSSNVNLNSMIKNNTHDHSNKTALVLCQRKTGPCDKNRVLTVEDTIVPRINQYISDYFTLNPVKIEYMTDDLDGTADYNFVLLRTDPKGGEFINDHRKFYDAVLINTCPISELDIIAIHEILKDTGVLIIKAMSCYETIDIPSPHITINERSFQDDSWVHIGKTTRQVVNEFFEASDDDNIFLKKVIA
jgi:hypothetical protein